MLFILPLNIASMSANGLALSVQHIAFYAVAFALNVALGSAVFFFHSLGNAKVKSTVVCVFFISSFEKRYFFQFQAILTAAWKKIRYACCSKQKVFPYSEKNLV